MSDRIIILETIHNHVFYFHNKPTFTCYDLIDKLNRWFYGTKNCTKIKQLHDKLESLELKKYLLEKTYKKWKWPELYEAYFDVLYFDKFFKELLFGFWLYDKLDKQIDPLYIDVYVYIMLPLFEEMSKSVLFDYHLITMSIHDYL